MRTIVRSTRFFNTFVSAWVGVACMALPHWAAAAACKITQTDLPIERIYNRPLAEGEINGRKIKVFISTDSPRTYLSHASAKRLGLELIQENRERMVNSAGEEEVYTARVSKLSIGKLSTKDVSMEVLESLRGDETNEEPLVLGMDFLKNFVLEFDLAHDAVRFLRPEGCKVEQLVYWDTSYFMADLERMDEYNPHFDAYVSINGRRTLARLSTDASVSYIAPQTARDANLSPEGAATDATAANKDWVARFDTFEFGNETIRNAKLRVSDAFDRPRTDMTGSHLAQRIETLPPDMLLGDDFLVSHRVLVLPREHKILFTYNGGRVFQVLKPND